MRSTDEVDLVARLIGLGLNDCEIARRTGIPRSTVQGWRSGRWPGMERPRRSADGACVHDFHALPDREYSYLLGVYLGDGCISAAPKGVWRLRIAMDAAYPGIVSEVSRGMEALLPSKRAHRYARPGRGYVEISMYWKHWPCLFPQHGPGRKHERRITLTRWQVELISKSPQALLRGLIHRDGCRIVANDRGLKSVRYHFSNRSEDIKGIFCDALESLGIAWTRPCGQQIAIYRRSCVEALDAFVGPKY